LVKCYFREGIIEMSFP